MCPEWIFDDAACWSENNTTVYTLETRIMCISAHTMRSLEFKTMWFNWKCTRPTKKSQRSESNPRGPDRLRATWSSAAERKKQFPLESSQTENKSRHSSKTILCLNSPTRDKYWKIETCISSATVLQIDYCATDETCCVCYCGYGEWSADGARVERGSHHPLLITRRLRHKRFCSYRNPSKLKDNFTVEGSRGNVLSRRQTRNEADAMWRSKEIQMVHQNHKGSPIEIHKYGRINLSNYLHFVAFCTPFLMPDNHILLGSGISGISLCPIPVVKLSSPTVHPIALKLILHGEASFRSRINIKSRSELIIFIYRMDRSPFIMSPRMN